VYDMAPKALIFCIASLLFGGTHALPSTVNGTGNGNCTLNATITQSCATKMDGKVPDGVELSGAWGEDCRVFECAKRESVVVGVIDAVVVEK